MTVSIHLPPQGYYKRHEDYIPILRGNFTGCFRAPVLLPPFLIHLSTPKSRGLVYHPPLPEFDGPIDDIIHFAFSAKTAGESCLCVVSLVLPAQCAHCTWAKGGGR